MSDISKYFKNLNSSTNDLINLGGKKFIKNIFYRHFYTRRNKFNF